VADGILDGIEYALRISMSKIRMLSMRVSGVAGESSFKPREMAAATPAVVAAAVAKKESYFSCKISAREIAHLHESPSDLQIQIEQIRVQVLLRSLQVPLPPSSANRMNSSSNALPKRLLRTYAEEDEEKKVDE
jgi:hypothetical protein